MDRGRREVRGGIGVKIGEKLGPKASEFFGKLFGAGEGGTNVAFHYTRSKFVSLIEKEGLRPGSYLTKSGDLSPFQAQLDLAFHLIGASLTH